MVLFLVVRIIYNFWGAPKNIKMSNLKERSRNRFMSEISHKDLMKMNMPPPEPLFKCHQAEIQIPDFELEPEDETLDM